MIHWMPQRERGGDRMLNSLLTEMERHEGIIMLATNRPLDLDEAMHRRITYAVLGLIFSMWLYQGIS
jgi:SpoVK/Ycf46/Vps4 family AAA+-type ATPase